MKRQRIILALVTLVVVAFAVWSVAGMASSLGLDLCIGSKEQKDSDSWCSEYRYFRGVDSGELNGEGEILHIDVDTEDGALNVTVQSPEGEALFDERFTSDDSRTVEVPEQVKVKVDGDGHQGGFDIHY